MDRLTTGIHELDQRMGGYPRERTFLVSGEAGTGKTIMGLHFTVACLERGESVLFLATEETPAGSDPAASGGAVREGQPAAEKLKDARAVLDAMAAAYKAAPTYNDGTNTLNVADYRRQLALALANRASDPILCRHDAEKDLLLADNTTSRTSPISAAGASGRIDVPVIEPTGVMAGNPMVGR